MKKIVLKIGGMTCSACSNSLEKHLNSKEGISNAIVNLVLNQALIEYDDGFIRNMWLHIPVSVVYENGG